MAKKEINVFSVSFLDLLSGALGAVLILYIIVPKLNIPLEEFEEQKKLSAEVEKLGVTLEDIKTSIPSEIYDSIQSQMNRIIQAKEELEIKIENTKRQLAECLADQQDNQNKIKALEKQVQSLEAQLRDCQQDLARCPKCDDCCPQPAECNCPEDYSAYKNWMDDCGLGLNDPCPPKQVTSSEINLGFKFSGRNVVFVVDVSGSMINNDQREDRLTPVKAGIRMLITTMGTDFQFDIVRFPYLNDDDYRANWGFLKSATPSNKEQASNFIKSLNADGGTPTRRALSYVLSNYQGISDIVLLSDGEPTANGTEDNINDILNMVQRMNTGNVQINTIGVGSDFLDNPTSPKVIFLKQLASNTGGFFVGF
ncbi:MAG: VWA domain-containing protein [Bacteroidota bacterium]